MEKNQTSQSAHTGNGEKPYWPYWYIHGKLYDLAPWLEKHPGGADFLNRCQGTDCTAAFEVHHLRMPKAKAMLSRFEVKMQEPAAESPWPQYDWTQYDELRKRIAKRLKAEGWQCGPSNRGKILALAALAINLSIPFIWPAAGPFAILLALIYAMNMIVMTGFGHIYLHLNTKWQYLGDLGGFSSHTWKGEHCLGHHLYTNHPQYDPDVKRLLPLVHFSPGKKTRWQRFAPLFIVPLYAVAFMALRLARPFEIVKDPRNWAVRLVWYGIGSFGWLALWWSVDAFWTGLLLECLASFLFLSITLSNHNHVSCHFDHRRQDFVKHQVGTCYDFGSVNYWPSLVFNAFLGNQTLHHLFPTIDPVYFPVIEDELKAMGYDYQRHSFWPTFFDHIGFIAQKDETHDSAAQQQYR